MELSLSLGYLLSIYGSDRLRSLEDAACLCKGAGFDFVDYSPICQGDAWEADVCRERELLSTVSPCTKENMVTVTANMDMAVTVTGSIRKSKINSCMHELVP